jgi:hypothetical protein
VVSAPPPADALKQSGLVRERVDWGPLLGAACDWAAGEDVAISSPGGRWRRKFVTFLL